MTSDCLRELFVQVRDLPLSPMISYISSDLPRSPTISTDLPRSPSDLSRAPLTGRARLFCAQLDHSSGDGSGVIDGQRLIDALDSAAMPADVAEALRPLAPTFRDEYFALSDFKSLVTRALAASTAKVRSLPISTISP